MKSKPSWSEIAGDIQRRAQADEIKHLKKQAATHLAALKDYEARLGVISTISQKRRLPAVPVVKATSAKTESAVVVGAGCWHVEETVKAVSVNGLNQYNLAIAEARLDRLFKQVVHQTDIQRAGTDATILVFALLGDLLTGFIHDELVQTNGLSPVQTLVWLADRIIPGIEYLRKHGNFKKIIIPCNYGNHGRTTHKMRVSTGFSNSYEWLLYKQLEKHFSESSDGTGTIVEFYVAEAYHAYVRIYDFILRTHHGDAIKYGGGIGGISVPVNKAISQWDKATRADFDLFAHWHQFKTDNKWVSTGSMIGRNAYSVFIKADPEPAQQAYFLVNKKYGRTVTLPIILQ